MIEFCNANVSFSQSKKLFTAVDDVSFSIAKGEVFGIAGSSGAGKSTLLRTINGLQALSNGKVLVDGTEVGSLKENELRSLRREIGMIFQHFNLAENKTVFDNIAFVLRAAGKSKLETEKRVNELLEFVGLKDKSNSYPSRLSGGQKQRVAIARALANNAKILLCDEPTSALDTETTASILSLLSKLNKELGITIVIITHQLDVIKEICTKTAFMEQGRVVEIGDTYTLFTEPKTEYVKQLISHTWQFKLPEKILCNVKGTIVRLLYHGERANEPVLSVATSKYGVNFNILMGNIEYIGGKPLGILYVSLEGEKDSVALLLAYLWQNVIELEVLKNGV